MPLLTPLTYARSASTRHRIFLPAHVLHNCAARHDAYIAYLRWCRSIVHQTRLRGITAAHKRILRTPNDHNRDIRIDARAARIAITSNSRALRGA